MKLAIYSSDGVEDSNIYRYYPSRISCWQEAIKKYPDIELGIFYTDRSTHLIETNIDKSINNISFHNIKKTDSIIIDFVNAISTWKADLAMAFSRPEVPFDWNSVSDSIIAQELEKIGISTIAHSSELAFDAFNKHRINKRIKDLGYNVPKNVYVQSSMLQAKDNYPVVTVNIYLEYILNCIKELAFPLIIKPSAGAGSVGIQVANNLEEVKKALFSEKKEDLLVEEMIIGPNFGVEVYRSNNGCIVFPPLLFNTTEYGITDPFQNFKIGPIVSEEFKIRELTAMLHDLAEKLDFKGMTELDLIFSKGSWYIIELNTRFSLLSQACAAIVKKNVPELALSVALDDPIQDFSKKELLPVIDFKIPWIGQERVDSLRGKFPSIISILDFSFGEDKDRTQYLELAVSSENSAILKTTLQQIYLELQDVISYDSINKLIDSLDSYLEALDV